MSADPKKGFSGMPTVPADTPRGLRGLLNAMRHNLLVLANQTDAATPTSGVVTPSSPTTSGGGSSVVASKPPTISQFKAEPIPGGALLKLTLPTAEYGVVEVLRSQFNDAATATVVDSFRGVERPNTPWTVADGPIQYYYWVRLIATDMVTQGELSGVAEVEIRKVDYATEISGAPDSGVRVVASEDLRAGDAVNLWDNDGDTRMRLALADSLATEAHGVVLQDVAAGAEGTMFRTGTIPKSAAVAGAAYFLSATVPGGVTTVVPSASGHIVQMLGVAGDGIVSFELGTATVLG